MNPYLPSDPYTSDSTRMPPSHATSSTPTTDTSSNNPTTIHTGPDAGAGAGAGSSTGTNTAHPHRTTHTTTAAPNNQAPPPPTSSTTTTTTQTHPTLNPRRRTAVLTQPPTWAQRMILNSPNNDPPEAPSKTIEQHSSSPSLYSCSHHTSAPRAEPSYSDTDSDTSECSDSPPREGHSNSVSYDTECDLRQTRAQQAHRNASPTRMRKRARRRTQQRNRRQKLQGVWSGRLRRRRDRKGASVSAV